MLNNILTQKELKKLLEYNERTGLFTRRTHVKRGKPVGSTLGTPSHGRFVIRVNGINYFSHRLAWLYVYGEWPKGEIDHINHNPSDNRIFNLRVVTRSGNMRNHSLRCDSTSGVNGVSWRKNRNKWRAYIRVEKGQRQKSLGYYTDKFEAICARMSANNKYGYHENHGTTLSPTYSFPNVP